MYFIDILVNDETLDTFPEKKLKYSLQNNNISEVKDRQSSYSDSYEVPKTAKNIRIMQGLGIPSDSSQIPYTKPSCQLKIEGLSFVVKGWMNVKDADDSYKIYIYSGIIEFFKSLENKTIGDIVGSDLDHVKDLETVIASFTNETYRYLIADFNGVTHYLDGANNVINIDYLVPSARIQYLWEKIHSFSNSVFTGDIFSSEAFTNLWITYPKSINTGELEDPVVESTGQIAIVLRGHNGTSYGPYDRVVFNAGTGMTSQTYFKATKKARYQVKMTIDMSLLPFPFVYSFSWVDILFYYTINQENIPYDQRANKVEFYRNSLGQGWYTGSGGALEMDEVEISFIIDLNVGDEVSFFTYCNTNQSWNLVGAMATEIAAYIPGTGSFSEELKSLDATDFFKEILNQLGLTPYTEEHSNLIRYKTINERLVEAPVLNWTEKYISRKGESYVHSSYAQNNRFKYQYNDKEDDHNNSGLLINNPNLNAYKDVFTSKTYSPEKGLTNFYVGSAGSRLTNQFKIYDKTIKEDANGTSIEYKGLEKRFHFVRAEEVITNVSLGSQQFDDVQTVNKIFMASFARLDWKTILEDNYTEMGRIMNDARLHEIDLYLFPTDVIILDLFCLVYFEQEQQYYLINKLPYTGSSVSRGTFVRVKRETEKATQSYIEITWADGSDGTKSSELATQDVILASITSPANDPPAIYKWEMDSGAGFVEIADGTTPKSINFPINGNYQIRYKATNSAGSIYYSNILIYNKVSASIYISDAVQINGKVTYKLHVEGYPFTGFVIRRIDANINIKIANLSINPYGGTLAIINPETLPASNETATAYTIPIGVYDCTLILNTVEQNAGVHSEATGHVGYSLTADPADQIVSISVSNIKN